MSYLIIVVIGAVVGFIAGQYLKGSEHGAGIDVAAGGVGGILAVFLSRFVGPAAAAGFFMSAVVAIIGAVAALYVMRQVMKPKAVPVPRPGRRY
ncbi:MAG TPA: GlsB/YeaQ/YmgE family stress response membrane protein [Thermoanaerobaculia bacterium]|jgi:uncharacterized membrane protein YeaQ/YmgE (transglycosylase-associated protein family)